MCRYLKFADIILARIIPTADRAAERIREARAPAELKEIIPRRIIMVDGTHIPVHRPSDSEECAGLAQRRL